MSTRDRVEALLRQGLSTRAIARELGLGKSTVADHVLTLRRGVTPRQEARLARQGVSGGSPQLSSAWFKSRPDENGFSESLHLRFRQPAAEGFEEAAADTIARMSNHTVPYPDATARAPDAPGALAVLDLADLHIGKLAVSAGAGAETTEAVDMASALARADDGIGRLQAMLHPHGYRHIALVIGNDILHADRWDGTTTSGTKMETDGSWASRFEAAQRFLVRTIERLAERAFVYVVHCPSNHDWQSGWFLAQTIRAWFRVHPSVSFGEDDYLVSLRHRKYLRFGRALIGFTHGDGAKEADLAAIMAQEQRAHWGTTDAGYWYTHHMHHKRRATYAPGLNLAERDGRGVTVVGKAPQAHAGVVPIEIVRSPTPPDGWHDRNGFLNRTAVECFLHAPGSGAQVARFTAWF